MQIKGKVVHGLKRGAKLGYPTANLECAETLCPMPGVYAAQVSLNESQYRGVVIAGAREYRGRPLIEVLLFDFEGDLYDQILEVSLRDKISDIEEFDSNDKLKHKIAEDIKKARKYFAELSRV